LPQAPLWRLEARRHRRPRMPLSRRPEMRPGKVMIRMAAVDPNQVKARTYGNWRRPRSAGIGGLGTLGSVGLLVGLIAVVFAMMIGGLDAALIVLAIVALVLVAMVHRDAHGRNVIDRCAARVGWWLARSRGSHLYRSGPLGRSLWGTHQLPGILAPTRLSEHQDAYGRRFALLYTPRTATYSIVIGTEPDGAALVDMDQVDRWVARWGLWLANLGDEPGIAGASVTVE